MATGPPPSQHYVSMPFPIAPQQGWVCPLCRRALSPWTHTCPYCAIPAHVKVTDGS